MSKCAPAVREYLKGLPKGAVFSPAEIARALGHGNAARVQRAFSDFMNRGEIVRVKKGFYRYEGIKQLRDGLAPIRERHFRAMHVKTVFTAREISMLADSTLNYTHEVFRQLRKTGEIERTGQRKGMRGQIEGVFRVCDRDAFFLNHLAPRRTIHRPASEPRGKGGES